MIPRSLGRVVGLLVAGLSLRVTSFHTKRKTGRGPEGGLVGAGRIVRRPRCFDPMRMYTPTPNLSIARPDPEPSPLPFALARPARHEVTTLGHGAHRAPASY